MTAYYNENNPEAAEWLEVLIRQKQIPPGVVDRRSILDVRPNELVGYTQCHFFAGIGGWPLALRLAGIPDETNLWTGSCPCQPFSSAGKGGGFDDERHLWPGWFHLIRNQVRRPPAILGEQVAAKAVEPWIDLVQSDLEALEYAFGCIAFPSASIGAPHIRDRAYWVADAEGGGSNEPGRFDAQQAGPVGEAGGFSGVGDPARGRFGEFGRAVGAGEVRHLDGHGDASGGLAQEYVGKSGGGRESCQIDVAESGRNGEERGPGPVNGLWGNADWLFCRDGKWRPVEPGTFPLAHGIPGRVGRLRGYGNAINVIAAAEFAAAWWEGRAK